jgi:LmbE family N-acetylglucosaminyl deacetylase
MQNSPDLSWPEKQNILVILAHPDDPGFFCGGTLARWAQAGHHIRVYLLTCGDKGRNDYNRDIPASQLCEMRLEEEYAAAAVIGAQDVHFLDREDGTLVPDIDLRRDVVRIIRQRKPDILVTCDPHNLYTASGLNHPDHRAAGQAVLDAVFPAAGNDLFFPELLAEGYQPHMPSEVWVSFTNQPNVNIDITDTWSVKIAALKEYKSQIGDPVKFEERMRSKHTTDSTDENPRFEENFRVIRYR